MVDKSITNIKYLALHVSFLILIATIPIHFYIDSQIDNNRLESEIALQKYAQKVAHKIYNFSNSYEEEFYYPRSSQYISGIYTASGQEIFSLFDTKKTLKNENIWEDDDNLYLKSRLKTNVFEAEYVLVAKQISYLPIVLNVLAMLIVIVVLIFIATLFLIKQSVEPYIKLNLYLENFIKDAMHEMKTPLGVILLNLDGLEAQFSNNTMIQRSKSALKNMIVVYEDLEFFVRNNVVRHPKESLDFSVFCHERVSFFQDLLDAKEIKIIKEIDPDIRLWFSPLELARILDNTLSNAIKYSKERTNISLKLKKEKNVIILSIEDEGRGIEDEKKIFQRYYRGDKIQGGFGIGLSIVKNICDKNGVDIVVDSKPEKGSTFSYRFGDMKA